MNWAPTTRATVCPLGINCQTGVIPRVGEEPEQILAGFPVLSNFAGCSPLIFQENPILSLDDRKEKDHLSTRCYRQLREVLCSKSLLVLHIDLR